MSETEPIRVLYMEDDAGLARLVQKQLERAGYAVDIARDGEEGLAMYATGSYEVVAVDQKMPGHDGLGAIRRLASMGPLPPIVMVTGTGDEQVAVEAMKLGARDYIVKDAEGGYLDLLPSVIEQVLHEHRLVEEKQRAEEALRASEARYRRLVQLVPDIIYLLDHEGKIVFITRPVEALGYRPDELLGTPFEAIVHPDDRRKARNAFVERRTGDRATRSLEIRLLTKRGVARDHDIKYTRVTISARGVWDVPDDQIEQPGKRFLGTLGAARDITERKRLEAAAQEAEKLRAIRDLADGVAHNFNNLLTGILGYATFIREQLKERNAPMNDVESLIGCVKRASNLTEQLRMSAAPLHAAVEPVALNPLLRQLAADCRASLAENVELVVNTPERRLLIRAAADTVRRALLNICINAQEAMPNGGTLTITADTERRKSADGEADFAGITITDTGEGIPGEVLPKIFDPFFSTKGTVGVGLSLAVTQRVIEDHGGMIEVASTPAKGTTFRVILPRVRTGDRE